MNTYTANLCITDKVGSKCTTNTVQKEVIIQDLNTSISLQNGYTLSVIKITSDYVTILMQNGIDVIIRNVYTTFPTEICITNTETLCQAITISVSITDR